MGRHPSEVLDVAALGMTAVATVLLAPAELGTVLAAVALALASLTLAAGMLAAHGHHLLAHVRVQRRDQAARPSADPGLQLDAVAVGIPHVERGARAEGAPAVGDVALDRHAL